MNKEKKAFLDGAVGMIFEQLVIPMGNWTRAELDEAMEYLTSRPYGDLVINNDIADDLSDIVGHMRGADEDEDEDTDD